MRIRKPLLAIVLVLSFLVGLNLGSCAERAEAPRVVGSAPCSGRVATYSFEGVCRLYSDGTVRPPPPP